MENSWDLCELSNRDNINLIEDIPEHKGRKLDHASRALYYIEGIAPALYNMRATRASPRIVNYNSVWGAGVSRNPADHRLATIYNWMACQPIT